MKTVMWRSHIVKRLFILFTTVCFGIFMVVLLNAEHTGEPLQPILDRSVPMSSDIMHIDATELVNLTKKRASAIVNDRLYGAIHVTYQEYSIKEPHYNPSRSSAQVKSIVDNYIRNQSKTTLQLQDEYQHGVQHGTIFFLTNGYVSVGTTCNDRVRIAEFGRQPLVGPLKHRKHVLCPLVIPGTCMFSGFLEHTLPKLMQVYTILMATDAKLVLPAACERQITMFLDLLGISHEKVEYHLNTNIHSDYQINTCDTPSSNHPVLMNKMRDIIGIDHVGTAAAANARGSVILLTPNQHGIHSSEGKIYNLRRLEQYLSLRYGQQFQLYEDQTSIRKALEVFRNARIIIVVSGNSAIWHMMFSRPRTRILEIVPWQEGTKTIVPSGLPLEKNRHMASLLGYHHWLMLAKVLSPQGGVVVDIGALDSSLDVLDDPLFHD